MNPILKNNAIALYCGAFSKYKIVMYSPKNFAIGG